MTARVLTVSPKPQASGVRELGRRWGITRQAALKVVARPGFPEPQELDMGRIWSDEDVAAWEAAEVAAGRALPGQTGYGRRKPDA